MMVKWEVLSASGIGMAEWERRGGADLPLIQGSMAVVLGMGFQAPSYNICLPTIFHYRNRLRKPITGYSPTLHQILAFLSSPETKNRAYNGDNRHGRKWCI